MGEALAAMQNTMKQQMENTGLIVEESVDSLV